MLPDRVSNPGPLTFESGALPIALHSLAPPEIDYAVCKFNSFYFWCFNGQLKACVTIHNSL